MRDHCNLHSSHKECLHYSRLAVAVFGGDSIFHSLFLFINIKPGDKVHIMIR